MKKISETFYVVEPNESITVEINAVNTVNQVNLVLDGNAVSLAEGPFKFQASAEQDTHTMVFLFMFTKEEGGSYQLNLSGSHGGNHKTLIKQSSGGSVISRGIELRVGSTGGGTSLGIEPPKPWPAG